MLEVYGLYKQATVGDINISKPAIDPKGKAKWTAWNSHKGREKENIYIHMAFEL
jgi:diazepam-binding inhibitor (GABA receptor modulating acyl-CoA-binding protein)